MNRDAPSCPTPFGSPNRAPLRRRLPLPRILLLRFFHRSAVHYLVLVAFSLITDLAQVPAASGAEGAASGAPSSAGETTIEGVQGLIRGGRYPEAAEQARILLHEYEQIYGVESMQTAAVLDVLAEAMRNAGQTGAPDAEEICTRAVRLKEKLAGKNTPAYATSLHNLGALHMVNGNYTKARAFLQEALEIRRRTLGEMHADVARSLLFLGVLDEQVGQDSAAFPLIERAAEIQRAVLSPDDPDRARVMNALAVLWYNRGDFLKPIPLWEEVLAFRRKALGADHPLVAETLHNLGTLSVEAGDNDQGLIYLEQALKIRRERLGKNNPLVAATLVVMASALRSSGDLAGALALCEEALRIRELQTNKNPTDLAETLRWTGRTLLERGEYARAKRLLTRARGILERELGPDNPGLAWTLSSLAAVAEHEGNRSEARSLYERSLRIKESVYGSSYPDVVTTEGEYAQFLASTGDSARAFDLGLRAARDRVEHLRTTARGLSERQALAYAAAASKPLDVVLGLASSGFDRRKVATAWDILIRSRTLVLDEIAARHGDALSQSQDSSVAAPRRELDAARRRFANLLVRGIGVDDPQHYRSAIDRAREEVEGAERALAAKGARSQLDRLQQEVGWSEVSKALPDGWGLAAFALYGSGAQRRYVAFVGGRDGAPAAVPLGPAAEIDALALRFVGALAGGDRTAAGAFDPKAEAACRQAGTALRRRIWDPIERHVGRSSRLFVVPDGSLHLVNFAALPTETSSYLVETGPLLQYLSAERDLVRIPTRREGVGLLALGGAAFDSMEESGPSEGYPGGASPRSTDRRRSWLRPATRGPQPECREFRDTRFPPLPESDREVREIASEWGKPEETVTLTGTRAGETAFKALAPGRRVLHLATHGFFLDATRCAVEKQGVRGIGGVATGTARRPRTVERRGSPLLLSGLALTGANLRLRAKPDQEDGILMAQEVVSLDLSKAEWVVLSACDTGLGKVQAGEGVLGLRRAFEAAGAGAVIMSLWEVEDRASREWMRRLYQARFRDKESTPEAVRDATLGVLRDRKAQGLGTHPFHWAGFVAAGDWR